MCGNSYLTASLKITDQTFTSVTLPAASIVNPPGWFIHELAAITIRAPRRPTIGIGTPDQKCAQDSGASSRAGRSR